MIVITKNLLLTILNGVWNRLNVNSKTFLHPIGKNYSTCKNIFLKTFNEFLRRILSRLSQKKFPILLGPLSYDTSLTCGYFSHPSFKQAFFHVYWSRGKKKLVRERRGGFRGRKHCFYPESMHIRKTMSEVTVLE